MYIVCYGNHELLFILSRHMFSGISYKWEIRRLPIYDVYNVLSYKYCCKPLKHCSTPMKPLSASYSTTANSVAPFSWQ